MKKSVLNPKLETQLKLLLDIFLETKLKLLQTRSPTSTGISAAKLASPSVTAAPWTSQATR